MNVQSMVEVHVKVNTNQASAEWQDPSNKRLTLFMQASQMQLRELLDGTNWITLDTNTSAVSQTGQWYDVQIVMDGKKVDVWWGTQGSALQKILSTDSATVLEGTYIYFYAQTYTMLHLDNIVVSMADPDLVEFEYNDSNDIEHTGPCFRMRNPAGTDKGSAGRGTYQNASRTFVRQGRQAVRALARHVGTCRSTWSWNTSSTQCYRYGGKPHVYTATAMGTSSTMSWVYQADGQLHREIVGTGNSGELFHWAGSRMIGETDSSGTFVRSFVQQPFWDMGGTLAEAPGSNPASAAYRYFELDEHGTPRVLRDQNKAMLAKFEYMPYGEPLSSAGVSSCMGYTGMWQSCNSGNLHFPLREYDPDIARWTTRDPLGMAGGPNMHIYVDGNPSSMVDPTGGMPWIVVFIIGGVLAWGAAGYLFMYYDNKCNNLPPPSLWPSTFGGSATVTAVGVAGEATAGTLALIDNPIANKLAIGIGIGSGTIAAAGAWTAIDIINSGAGAGVSTITPSVNQWNKNSDPDACYIR